MSAVFISHHSSDGASAAEVHDWLAEKGHRSLFLDFDPESGIPAGRNWEHELYQQLRACRAVIVLCSEAAMASKWVFAEMTHARALGKHIMPVKIADCTIDRLISDRQIIDMTAGKEEALQRLWRGLLAAGIDPADAFDWDGSRPPYPGLISFQEEDAAVFFGREKETADGLDLLNRIRRQGSDEFVMVLGSSGSGKSSLVRAGLVPYLRQDQTRWIVLDPIRPRDDPGRELAAALSRAFAAAGDDRSFSSVRERIGSFTATSKGGADNPLVELAAELLSLSGRPEASVLVIVDQFEELLVAGGESRAGEFLALLRNAVSHSRKAVVVLGTMRSDFLANFQDNVRLQGVRYQSLSLGPLAPDAIAQVIQRPADVAGLELEAGLTELMVVDTRAADALPLLAFTLRELYEQHGGDGKLTVAEYRDQLGGLNGAVAKVADETLAAQRLDHAGLDQLRHAFMSMVRLTEDGKWAKRAVRWDDLAATVHPVIEAFVAARLLVADADDEVRTVEVAHEALFRSWEQLTGWLRDNASDLRLRRDLVRVARQWRDGGRSDDDVWRGGRLERVGEMLGRGEVALDELTTEFVEASHRVHEAEVRRATTRRRVLIGAAIVATVLALVASFSFVRARSAEEAAQAEAERAERTAVIALARQAEALSRSDPALAVAVAAEADSRLEQPATARALLIAQAALRNSHLVANLAAHSEPVVAVDMTGDGLRVVTGSWDGTARIWDAGTGAVLRTLPDQGTTVSAVAFNGSGTVVATGNFNGVVQTWDVASGELVKVYGEHDGAIVDIVFSPDDGALATASFDGTARLWDVASGDVRHELVGHEGPVADVAFSPDGLRLATSGREGTARIWEVATAAELLVIDGHEDSVVGVAFSPDGRSLATTSWDRTARLWDASTGAPQQTFNGHTRRVMRAGFTPDGSRLVTTSWDTTARVWDVGTGVEIMRLDLHTRRVEGMALSADGARLATASWDTTAKVWDVAAGRILTLADHGGNVRDVAVSGDGETVLSASFDGAIRVWDATSGELLRSVDAHARPVLGVAFHPNGTTFATASVDGTAGLWDLTSGRRLLELDENGGPVQAVAFSPDGAMIATGGSDGMARVWDAATGRLLGEFRHGDDVLAVAFHPEGSLLGTASADRTARLWDLETRGEVHRLGLHRGAVQAIAFSPDGVLVATGSWDETARVWNVESGEQRRIIDDHADRVLAVAFDAASTMLATGGLDNSARVWDLGTGEELVSLVGHVDAVRAVEFVPGVPQLVTGSDDETVGVWDNAPTEACAAVGPLVTLGELVVALSGTEPTACDNLRE